MPKRGNGARENADFLYTPNALRRWKSHNSLISLEWPASCTPRAWVRSSVERIGGFVEL